MVRTEESYGAVRPDLDNPTWDTLPTRRWRASPLNVGVLSPDDVADAALFLLSSRARCITSVALPVDGGVLLR